VQVDNQEQNTIDEQVPFIIGNEARPQVLTWESSAEFDIVVAEHYGYGRLAQPVTHRRTVRFDKTRRFWFIADELLGGGAHQVAFRFHCAPGLESKWRDDGIVEVWDKMSHARLLIVYQKPNHEGGPSRLAEPIFESQFSSNDYGAKAPSVCVCWKAQAELPLTANFILIPVRADEDEDLRLELLNRAGDLIGSRK
jgi:hypothetical protein